MDWNLEFMRWQQRIGLINLATRLHWCTNDSVDVLSWCPSFILHKSSPSSITPSVRSSSININSVPTCPCCLLGLGEGHRESRDEKSIITIRTTASFFDDLGQAGGDFRWCIWTTARVRVTSFLLRNGGGTRRRRLRTHRIINHDPNTAGLKRINHPSRSWTVLHLLPTRLKLSK